MKKISSLSVFISVALLASCSSTAYKINKLSADSFDDARSNYNVGYSYLHGKGVDINYDEAYKYLLKSAQKGFTCGINDIGVMHENGWGVEKDLFKATNTYKLAATKDKAIFDLLYNNCIEIAKKNFERLRHIVVALPIPDSEINAIYPKYKITRQINTVFIIGEGPGKEEIQNYLINILNKYSEIKIIDPNNISTIIGGSIIEQGTGLSLKDSIDIARKLQADHCIYFTEKVSPYSEYIYGGRAFVQIDLKIIRSIDGTVVFSSSGNSGALYVDPRPYGYTHRLELNQLVMQEMREHCFMNYIRFPLSYALGFAEDGIIYDRSNKNEWSVWNVLINSPAFVAGIKKGDIIEEIIVGDRKISKNVKISSLPGEYIQNQGNTKKIKINREGNIMEVEIKYPIIPDHPEIKDNQPEEEKKFGI